MQLQTRPWSKIRWHSVYSTKIKDNIMRYKTADQIGSEGSTSRFLIAAWTGYTYRSGRAGKAVNADRTVSQWAVRPFIFQFCELRREYEEKRDCIAMTTHFLKTNYEQYFIYIHVCYNFVSIQVYLLQISPCYQSVHGWANWTHRDPSCPFWCSGFLGIVYCWSKLSPISKEQTNSIFQQDCQTKITKRLLTTCHSCSKSQSRNSSRGTCNIISSFVRIYIIES